MVTLVLLTATLARLLSYDFLLCCQHAVTWDMLDGKEREALFDHYSFQVIILRKQEHLSTKVGTLPQVPTSPPIRLDEMSGGKMWGRVGIGVIFFQ